MLWIETLEFLRSLYFYRYPTIGVSLSFMGGAGHENEIHVHSYLSLWYVCVTKIWWILTMIACPSDGLRTMAIVCLPASFFNGKETNFLAHACTACIACGEHKKPEAHTLIIAEWSAIKHLHAIVLHAQSERETNRLVCVWVELKWSGGAGLRWVLLFEIVVCVLYDVCILVAGMHAK